MDISEDTYWNYETQPRNRIPMGAIYAHSLPGEAPAGATKLHELFGNFPEQDRCRLDETAHAMLTTTLIGNCQAIALRVYAQGGALCWLFAPTDPEATRALAGWCERGKVKLVANFGSDSEEVVLQLSPPQGLAEALHAGPRTRDFGQVQRLCDKVGNAESDGLLNSLAFAPMTHAVERRLRSTCLVASTLVALAFKSRT